MKRFVRLAELRANGCVEQLPELIPYAQWLGLEVSESNQELKFRLAHRPGHIGNPALPAIHGGVLAGFMENAGLLALIWRDAPRRIPKTVDFSIDYLSSAGPTDCFARCEITRMGSRIAQCQLRCWQADEQQPVAIARAHFLLESPSGG